MTEQEILKGLKLYFDETNINATKLYQTLGKKKYKEFDQAYQALYESSTESN